MSLINRLTRMLGITASSKDAGVTLDIPTLLREGPASLRSDTSNSIEASEAMPAQAFDYERASCSTWGWYRSDSLSGTEYFSLGSPGEVPMAVVLPLIGHARMPFIRDCLWHAMWIRESDPAYQPWWEGNAELRKMIGGLEGWNPTEEIASFSGMSSSRISLEFERLYRMRYPALSADSLCESEASISWQRSETSMQLAAALVRAWKAFEAAAADWFEARGFTVDREHHTVKVDGYRPMIVVRDIAMY